MLRWEPWCEVMGMLPLSSFPMVKERVIFWNRRIKTTAYTDLRLMIFSGAFFFITCHFHHFHPFFFPGRQHEMVQIPKFNSSPLKSYLPNIGEDRLPTTFFQGQTVKLRECAWFDSPNTWRIIRVSIVSNPHLQAIKIKRPFGRGPYATRCTSLVTIIFLCISPPSSTCHSSPGVAKAGLLETCLAWELSSGMLGNGQCLPPSPKKIVYIYIYYIPFGCYMPRCAMVFF